MKASRQTIITLTTKELETIKAFADILMEDVSLDCNAAWDIVESITQEDNIVLSDYGYALNII